VIDHAQESTGVKSSFGSGVSSGRAWQNN